MSNKINPITINDLLSGLELLDLKESLKDTYSSQVYEPLLKDTSVGKKFLSMSPEELHKILTVNFHQLASSQVKMTQHFYGNIVQAPVKLSTFLKKSATVENYFYTNYKVLNEITATPVDQNNDVLVASSDGVNIAYIKSKASENIFIARRPALNYMSFSTKSSPQVEEGRRIRDYANSVSSTIRNTAFDRLSVLVSPEEKQLLEEFKKEGQIYPVLVDSISFAFVDALNLISSSTRIGSSKQAANALLGHSYLTRGAFDQETLFSLNPAVSNDIHTDLSHIVSFQPPYINKWAPNTADFDLADKRVRSAPSTFKSVLNMFFSTFGNLYSALSKSVGRSSNEPMDLSFFTSTSSVDAKIDHTIDLMSSGKLWATQSIDKLLANAFTRLVWNFSPEGNYYSVGLDIVSLNVVEDSETGFISITGTSFLADKKLARLPVNATTYLLHGKNYSKEEYLKLYKSAGATATVNGGNENVLRQILNAQLLSTTNDQIFSKTPQVIYAGIPKIFMQLSSSNPDKLLVLPKHAKHAFTGLVSKLENEKSLKILMESWSKEKQKRYKTAIRIIVNRLEDSFGAASVGDGGSSISGDTIEDLILRWIFNPKFSPLLTPGEEEERNASGNFVRDASGAIVTKKVPGLFSDLTILKLIERVIKQHLHEQFVTADTPIIELLHSLYNPSFSMVNIDNLNHSVLFENLQSGLWAFEESPDTFIGAKNIISKVGNMLQLNEDILLDRYNSFSISRYTDEED